MAPAPDRHALRYEGGAAWVDLLGTLGYPFSDAPAERLGDRARLAAFLGAVDLKPAKGATEADVAGAHALRAALRTVALAVVEDCAPDRAALTTVAAWADRDAAPLALERAPRLRRRAPRDAGEALGRLARQALEQLTGPSRSQVHACAEPECRKLFLDAGGRRRWCSPQTCGTRARVRALRERRREAAEGA
jgi:predicted RNA-binding Zn ribbon-like protein